MRTTFKISLLAAAIALTGCNQEAKQTETAAADTKAADTVATSTTTLTTETEKVAYAIGASIGDNVMANIDSIIAQQNELEMPLNQQLIVDGISDALAAKTQMPLEEQEQVLAKFQQEMQTLMMAKQQEMQQKAEAAAKVELEEGAKWMAEMAKLEGATTTDSGLVLVKHRDGNGTKPSAEDSVEVHYRGTLRDGTQFDSSYDRGETIQFPLSGVIAGWTEGLQLMDVGSKYDLYIPSELAYGERGAGADIPGNAPLKFEIELISIPSQEKPAAE